MDNLYCVSISEKCSLLQNLSENNIGSIGAAAICEMMLENSTIRTLELSGELIVFTEKHMAIRTFTD